MFHFIYVSTFQLEPQLATNEHSERKLNEERALADQKRKECDDQLLYMAVRVITETSFKAHQGTDLAAFDKDPETNPGAAKCYRLPRSVLV
jgi:ubiquitin carboxyl-terminal hydrolase 7